MAGSSTPKPTLASSPPPNGKVAKPPTTVALTGSALAGPDSKNPALAGLAQLFLQHAPLPLGIAYSGGADSTALLLAAAERWPGQIVALHVHHGLQSAAELFVSTCTAVCAAAGVPLQILRVNASAKPGESPEDAARRARYAALATAGAAAGVSGVLLGQHADDQVETLLLALSRGAGLPGLSAMPAQFKRHGIAFYRPLLQLPAASLRDWLQAQQIAFVDDPTNGDERYTRNRIRAQLLPALAKAFPQFRTTFARSARHAAEAQALLLDMASLDLATVGEPPAVRSLQALSRPRQANVLRHWLLRQQATPSTAQLDALLAQVEVCTTRGHRIHLKVGGGHVTRSLNQDGDSLCYTPLAA